MESGKHNDTRVAQPPSAVVRKQLWSAGALARDDQKLKGAAEKVAPFVFAKC
jgi:hypothetical protein